MKRAYDDLMEIYKKVVLLGTSASLLHWDQEVLMPKDSLNIRSEQLSLISSMVHEMITNKQFGQLLQKSKKEKLDKYEKINLKEIDYAYNRIKKIPASLVEEMSKIETKSLEAWKLAREKSDFKIFLPHLKKIINLKIKQAKYINSKKKPYEVIFEGYERDISLKEIDKLFMGVKNELIPLIKEISKKKKFKDDFLNLNVKDEIQYKLSKDIAQKLGLDFNFARIDISTHPFSTKVPDTRITTRYTDGYSHTLMSTIHETGHALYEQNLPRDKYYEPIGDSRSVAIHESQSRFWEKIIGSSYSFWKYYLPYLRKEIKELRKVDTFTFYKSINGVEPDLIRVNANELTYPMHVILRYEIEKDIFSGKLKPENIPKEWNRKMKEYLGVTPSNDRLGCLQDIHWSQGDMGYFPTYLLGTMLSAQILKTMERKINVDKEVEKGNFKPILNWLVKNIHKPGSTYETKELIRRATGKDLSYVDYVAYLKEKYTKLYSLDK